MSAAVAAVDCGTNSTRLLILDGAGHAIQRRTEITRLGQGVDAAGRLRPDAIERVASTLRDYRSELEANGVSRCRAVATSAVRDAANGTTFLDAAEAALGVRPELISGREEGMLSFAGATAELPPTVIDRVVVDIGGGSTEIVVGRESVTGAISVDIGCVRLTERHLRSDPPTPDELAAARGTIRAGLDQATAVLKQIDATDGGCELIGLAGTVATLAALDQKLTTYDRSRVHHYWLPRDAVARWCTTLAAESTHDRSQRPVVARGREDVLVAGVLVLTEILHRLSATGCLASESDILDGIANTLLRRSTGLRLVYGEGH